MTLFESIKQMNVDEMALMLHTIIKATEQKLFDKLIEANIDFNKIELADEIQIAIHKKYLESEVKNDNAE